MPKYQNNQKLLEDSLNEIVVAVEFCLSYEKKEYKDMWKNNPNEGECLGFPAASMLMSIIDTIGSYHHNVGINIDGKTVFINSEKVSTHFYILNHNYFGFNFSLLEIEQIYGAYRNKLVHNSSLPNDRYLDKGNSGDSPFIFENDPNSGKTILNKVNLVPLCATCSNAIKSFIKNYLSGNKTETDISKYNSPLSKSINDISKSASGI